MLTLVQVVLPVFLVTATGYALVRGGYFKDGLIDSLNRYTQAFAIPLLLFNATRNMDIAAVFNPGMLISFYTAATTTFVLGIVGARLLFRRRPGEAVAIGFGSLFSNSVILGIPLVERAYGGEALAAAIAIISVHAPFCYFLGITVMEISRADGRGAADTARAVLSAMLRNALMVGIALGFAANLTGLSLPQPLQDSVDMVVRSALPVALFALGGVLTRYTIRASIGEALMTSALSLIVHPAITFALAYGVFGLPILFVKAAVTVAAMAPGVNTYIFATLYNRAEGAAASTVMLATTLSLLSVWGWLSLLSLL
ncbi:AEC family transporter [Rhodobacteraceae bacterium 2CG4]|uniref:AEC family transporter n=1 Tax=Halovulum marinum TaxID=2662447 RepID=A0A6L5YZZ0_9RHOB|nr:AEC family transporter [Halovulum marinum]MSU89841.1 AEC family transporter [Halovulum marinum]